MGGPHPLKWDLYWQGQEPHDWPQPGSCFHSEVFMHPCVSRALRHLTFLPASLFYVMTICHLEETFPELLQHLLVCGHNVLFCVS